MTPGEAARKVLADDPGSDLHWTVIWDRALRAGYVDPLANPEARGELVRALAEAVRDGTIVRTSKGTYRHR